MARLRFCRRAARHVDSWTAKGLGETPHVFATLAAAPLLFRNELKNRASGNSTQETCEAETEGAQGA
jgi:hypothetical protein